MGKITFRADDELVAELEAFDASKSEVMREALRTYLDAHAKEGVGDSRSDAATQSRAREDSLDALIETRIDSLLAERFEGSHAGNRPREAGQDVNITIALEGVSDHARVKRHDQSAVDTQQEDAHTGVRTNPIDASSSAPGRHGVGSVNGGDSGDSHSHSKGQSEPARPCGQCGSVLGADHVFCPNCGEKASHRLFCECGDEVRSDWSFCPSCGRRTPAADVLESDGV
ncbi:zinc ribbon domain-containing protein [Halobacteria archaeon AArc-curdl1]|uniref:Zinc ribbon domain-containing protein n=1 Tax=Natronosalvus hydrolyticus TaxID=2979988 RepID=A0AAP2Z6C7_9EURY|nr:zinc ribbon domain-containing protein [Halobacteria archaeon AArc-curdl1]